MNQPLQARAGQNAPFPWGFNAHTRGKVLGVVVITGDKKDQTLIEAVDEPILLAAAGGITPGGLGFTIGTGIAAMPGTTHLVDDQGNVSTALGVAMFTPDAAGSVDASGLLAPSGAFLLAPGEKIIFRPTAAVPTGGGLFYPNAGYIPNDPSELKPYRIDLADGARHVIAEAPPGKALVCLSNAGAGSFGGWGIVMNSDSGAGPFLLKYFLDDEPISTAAGQALAPGTVMPKESGVTSPAWGSTVLVLPAGSKLEAEVTGVSKDARVLAMLSLRMENGS